MTDFLLLALIPIAFLFGLAALSLFCSRGKEPKRLCGSCRHWLHKSSDHHGDYGACGNDKVVNKGVVAWVARPRSWKDAELDCAIRFEEHGFGCIHWEPDKD